MSKPRIAIVGAGPGGLTAAVILQRDGHEVCVYEAEPHSCRRAQGGSLDLHEDKGQLALKQAGLLEAFRRIARHEDQNTRDVEPFTGVYLEREPRDDEALDRPEIDRGVLRDMLLDGLVLGTVQWGARLIEVQCGDQDALHLIFADGSKREADIVIGADGAWSRVRAALTSVQPFYTGVTFLEGWIEKPHDAIADLVGRGTLFSFGGEEALFAQRNGLGRICVYAAVRREREWLKNKLMQIKSKILVEKIYENWAVNLKELIGACDEFIERPIYAMPPDMSWSPSIGVTLIGDAAHLMPPVGLGVNLAMLDAADVASALKTAVDWKTGLREAEARICARAKALMPGAINGFMEMFATDQHQDHDASAC